MPDPAVARQAIADAKVSAKNGDLASSEATISTLNRATQGSADWHTQMSSLLLHLADDLSREGSAGSIPSITSSCVRHLEIAFSLAASAASKAGIKMAEGFIEERYAGELPAALANYKEAAVLAPDNVAIKLALARLGSAKSPASAAIAPSSL